MAHGAFLRWWVAWLAVSAALSCGQRSEPVASTGTSETALAPAAGTGGGHEPKSRPSDIGGSAAPSVDGCTNALAAVRTISPTHCEVPRSVLLDDSDCLLARPQLKLYVLNGRTLGFRHDAIPSRSVYAACGVHSGDVWTKLNGEPLNNPDQALRLYPSLREAKQLEIELLRGTQPLQVVIELR